MEKQYNSILKATVLFGGIQIVQILVGIIKTKFIAILIGSTGIGLTSLYTSSLTLFISIFSLGLSSSVVKELSKAQDEDNKFKFSQISTVYFKLLLFFALLGMFSVIIMSSYLSNISFKNDTHTLDYCFLSLVVIFTLLQQGNTAIIIGSRQIKRAAMCTLYGSIINVIVSIPLFYFFKLEGVVPGLVLSCIGNYLVSYFYIKKIHIEKIKVNKTDFKYYSKVMISLGIAMILANLIGNITNYLLNISITRMGGLSDLGLFNAATNLTIQSMTLILSAMASDYYPRLAASFTSIKRMNETVNEQSEIIFYIAVPLLSFFILFSPIIIYLLLSSEFYKITYFIRILCLGMYFKIICYATGYISFAKGDKLVFICLEGLYSNLANLVLSVIFYFYWGLIGLAYAFLVASILRLIILFTVCHKRYQYIINKELISLFIISSIILLSLITLTYLFNGLLTYLIGTLFCCFITYYFLKKMNSKTFFISYIKNKMNDKLRFS